MTVSNEVRQQRVANGSRRKRDLEAAKPKRLYDPEKYAAQHFPDEHPAFVPIAAFAVSARHHHREYPKPDEVFARLEETGRTMAQLREQGLA